MRLRDAFFRKFGANNLGGATIGGWLRILRDNRFAIDPGYWPRAAAISLFTVPNTLTAIMENCRYGRAVDSAEIKPPLFILGAWRSGTTHLHNLLAIDTRFAYSNQFQVLCPQTFLLFEAMGSRLMSRVMPGHRPQDSVKMGASEPQEEDFAMCSMGGQANLMAWAFPRNAAFYRRYMTLTELSADELARWKRSYRLFLKKLCYKYGRPLVLKSPANTGRIKTLLDLFPDAKFVHIHRDPHDIYRSNVHTMHTAGPWWQLQRIDYENAKAIHSHVVDMIKTLYDGYFAQRTSIPDGRLHQVAFCGLGAGPDRAASRHLRGAEFAKIRCNGATVKSVLEFCLELHEECVFRLARLSTGIRLSRMAPVDAWDYAA